MVNRFPEIIYKLDDYMNFHPDVRHQDIKEALNSSVKKPDDLKLLLHSYPDGSYSIRSMSEPIKDHDMLNRFFDDFLLTTYEGDEEEDTIRGLPVWRHVIALNIWDEGLKEEVKLYMKGEEEGE